MTPKLELDPGFAKRYGPWALIVGASDGIGAACARLCAANGLKVALLARNQQKLDAVSREIEEHFGVETRTLSQDLTDTDLVASVAARTADLEIGLLLCITGSSLQFAHFLDERAEDCLSLVQRNVMATVALAHHFGQAMKSRGGGGMLFCTSMAGFSGMAYQAIYSATKAFNQMLGESLWHDLHPFGIDAMCLGIGATKTESTDALGLDFDAENSMTPEDVAFEGLSHLGREPLWIAGEHNRALLPFVNGTERAPIIEAMSQATAEMKGLPYAKREPREG